mgnify:CR=1 FL=1
MRSPTAVRIDVSHRIIGPVLPAFPRAPFARACAGLHEYELVVFTSANGVDCMFDALASLRLGAASVAAVDSDGLAVAALASYVLLLTALPGSRG